MHELQAAAAVGQMGLVQAYESAFARFGLHTAQILLTHDDLADRRRYLNARSTLFTLLALDVIPIINENDTVTTDEIRFGDNDTLGALVTNLIEADVLVLLTDQPGLFTADPRRDPAATLVRTARAGEPRLEAMAGGAGSAVGSGGMLSKVLAAKRAARSGASTVIADGREENVLTRLAAGEEIGTSLVAPDVSLGARKQWLADHVQLAGRLTLDAGAVRALVRDGKSLLPIGVVRVEGSFERGEIVGCFDPDGREIARGLVNYSAPETARILRKPSSEIAGDPGLHRRARTDPPGQSGPARLNAGTAPTASGTPCARLRAVKPRRAAASADPRYPADRRRTRASPDARSRRGARGASADARA